jgi:mono/diheme cytochrome c family protein
MLVLACLVAFGLAMSAGNSGKAESAAAPTFFHDVLPILQQHCQQCHRPGEIAPMPLVTYEETKSWARQIAKDTRSKRMPPWFADPCCGHFSDDPSLTEAQIATLSAWAETRAPGDPRDAPAPPRWTEGWNISPPDVVLKMPKAVAIPAEGDVEYTYEIVPTDFTEDKWIRMSEIRPASRQFVHHAVVYIRPPGSKWLRGAPINTPFTASSLKDPALQHQAHETKSDLLLVYAPGSSPDRWPENMAKFIPAHSDLVFQMHYTTKGQAGTDQTSVGLVFAKNRPAQRVLSLQLANDHDPVPIPPNTDNYRVEVHGTLPNDAVLLSFFPHMHLRGKRFEYNLVHPDHTTETLLRVNYDFYWQLSYRLAEPRPIKAGSTLQAVAWYDNSANNAHNPDPDRPVLWGDQTYNEMMVGFFDVAVPASVDKEHFFIRSGR